LTPLEEIVTAVWAAVLGRDRVGAEENFFDLGGHSLLATRVIARLSQACQVDLPIRALFEHPTARGLAAVLATAMKTESGPLAPPITRVDGDRGDRRDLPLSFAQERMWFLDRMDPDSPAYNLISVLRLTGSLDVPALAASFTEIFRRHETLRTTFSLSPSGSPVQVIGPVPESALAVVHPALLRLGRLDEDVHVLAVSTHHIVVDDWSAGIFTYELSTLYTAFRRG